MSHDLRTPVNAIGDNAELTEFGIHAPVAESQRAALAALKPTPTRAPT